MQAITDNTQPYETTQTLRSVGRSVVEWWRARAMLVMPNAVIAELIPDYANL